MKRIVVAVAVVVGLTISASTAQAQQPEIFEFDAEVDDLLWDCGDYEIWDATEVHARVKVFSDKNGDFSKLLIHGWINDTFYNKTTGESIEGGSNGYNYREEADSPGALIHHGLMYHATVPGVGRVLVDAGHFVMQDPWLYPPEDWRDSITWQKGNHQNIDGDFDKMCEVLR